VQVKKLMTCALKNAMMISVNKFEKLLNDR
jgi:hypothetical protein